MNVCFYFGECSFTSVLDVYRTSCLMNAFGSGSWQAPLCARFRVLRSQAAENVWLLRMSYDKVAISVRFFELMQ